MRHILCGLLFALSLTASAQENDIPKTFAAPTANQDYIKRDVMIPMRDGVKLHTVIVVPKGGPTRPQSSSTTPVKITGTVSRIGP